MPLLLGARSPLTFTGRGPREVLFNGLVRPLLRRPAEQGRSAPSGAEIITFSLAGGACSSSTAPRARSSVPICGCAGGGGSPPLSRALARRPGLLPDRAGAFASTTPTSVSPRTCAYLRRIHDAAFPRPAERAWRRLITFLIIPVGSLGAAVAGLHRHRCHDSRLHGGGVLCCMPIIGTFLANLVGRRLIPLNFLRQRFEANFRFALVRVRENAEGIALYKGEQREAGQSQPSLCRGLRQRLAGPVHECAACLLPERATARSRSSFRSSVSAPRFFAGAITLGVVMQTVSAFGQVQPSLSFFVDNYTLLAELRAVMDRLKGLQVATDEQAGGDHRRREFRGPAATGVSAERLDAWPCQTARSCSRTRRSTCRRAERR